MDEKLEQREVYVDLLMNQPKNEINRKNVANLFRQQFERGLEESVDRYWDLPQLILEPKAEYLELLLEARDLYIGGRFYSCVAMCGIVNERLIKDTLRASVL